MSRFAAWPRTLFTSSCLLAALALNPARPAAAQEAPDTPAPAPVQPRTWSWELARLEAPNLGKALGHMGDWCSEVVTNTGAIAQRWVASKLFVLPLGEGVDPDAPATLVWIDPALMGGRFRQVQCLSVKDAAALKAFLMNAYGATERDGRLRFAITGSYDEPDRPCVVEIVGGRAWVAPNDDWLDTVKRALTSEAAAGHETNGGAARDASLRLNFTLLSAHYQKDVVMYISFLQMLAMALYPSANETLANVKSAILTTSEQVERATLEVSFTEGEAYVDAQVFAKAGTRLAQLWNKQAPKMGTGAIRWAPKGVAAFAQMPSPYLMFVGYQVLGGIQMVLGAPDEKMKVAMARWFKATTALSDLIDGEIGVAVQHNAAGKGSAAQYVVILRGKNPAAMKSAWEDWLKSAEALGQLSYTTWNGTPAGGPPAFKLAALEKTDYEKTSIQGLKLVFTSPWTVPADARGPIRRLLGWPLEIRHAQVDGGLLLALGAGGDEGLKPFIHLAQHPDVEGMGRLGEGREMPKEFGQWQAGTDVWKLVNIAGLAEILADAAPDGAVDANALLRGLSAEPLRSQLETGERRAQLKLWLPPLTARALVDLYFRMQRQGINPGLWLSPDTQVPAAAEDDTGANVPPPPPAD